MVIGGIPSVAKPRRHYSPTGHAALTRHVISAGARSCANMRNKPCAFPVTIGTHWSAQVWPARRMGTMSYLHIGMGPQSPRVAVSAACEQGMTTVEPACFLTSADRGRWLRAFDVRLGARAAEALAELLPLLLCGEESAALAFGRYAGSAALHAAARDQLDRIRADEERHATWLQRLKLGLPAPRPDKHLVRQIRHFYVSIREPELGAHLARIAALDSAVCVLLGALRRRCNPIGADAALAGLFARIHRDEARHVTIARNYARLLGGGCDLLGLALETRQRLTRLLARRADAFEQLGVCPDTTLRRLSAVSHNLFA